MVAPTPMAPMSKHCLTVPKSVWSYVFGYEKNSLWLIFTMNGILWAYRRATTPRDPKVEATALHPPSRARRTMLSGSTGVEHALEVPEDPRLAIGVDEDPIDVVGTGQLELLARDGPALMLEEVLGVGPEQLLDALGLHGRYFRPTLRKVN